MILQEAMKIISTKDGENYTHKALWMIVKRQLAYAQRAKKGAILDDAAAMVFAFHAFEAYLNFLGSRLAPKIWTDEENFFRKQPYRGFSGKVRKIFELCDLEQPDLSVKSYQTIWELKALRDQIAHGKIEKISEIHEHEDDEISPLLTSIFDKLVTTKKAMEAKDDVHRAALILHNAAKPKIKDIWFGDDPFSGPLGQASSESSVAPS